MAVLTRENLAEGWDLRRMRFWRCLAIAFCAFSLVGHWIEIPYCLFMDGAFGIVEDDSLVWDDPFYPFCVYGVAAVLAALFLVPFREFLVKRRQSIKRAVFDFYIAAVIGCMLVELVMGLMLNQPDPITGEYPLWDNSVLPLNILGQAWLVNDLLLGAVVTVYVWALYPLLAKGVSFIPEKWGWPVTIVVVAAFVVLCIVKFG